MKRKPIDIMADLSNILNGRAINMDITINDIKEKADIHWNTAKDYLYLIYFIQNMVPKLNILKNEENFTISLKEHSSLFHNLGADARIILQLFLKKAFTEQTAMFIENPNHRSLLIQLEQNKTIFMLDNQKYFLRRSGKIRAKEILSQIYQRMHQLIENYEVIDGENTTTPSPRVISRPLPYCYSTDDIYSRDNSSSVYEKYVQDSDPNCAINYESQISRFRKIQSSDCA